MTKVCMGYAAGYGPYLKIMINDEDDPVLTDDLDYSKFLFNSKTDKYGYVWDIMYDRDDNPAYSYPAPSPSEKTQMFPPGSSFETMDKRVWSVRQSGGSVYRRIEYNLRNIYGDFGDDYMIPLIETNYGSTVTGRWYGPAVNYTQTGSEGIRFAGFLRSRGTSIGWTTSRISNYFYKFPVTGYDGTRYIPNILNFSPSVGGKYSAIIWNLPGNNRPINLLNDTPIPGQEQIKISKTTFKIARAGFSVAATDPNKLILSSDFIPAKIMRSGEVSIDVGDYADIYTPLPMTDSTVLDYIVRRSGQVWTTPPALQATYTQTSSIACNYAVFSNYIRLYNTGNVDIDVRYMIFADDAGEQTSGGTKVVRKANDGVQDYIQFKRPGSSDVSPALNEIYLDTRLATIPLIKEGYVSIASFNESPTNVEWGWEAKTVSFTNTGFTPFLKYMVVFSQGGGREATEYPHFDLHYTSTGYTWKQRPARGSTMAEIRNSYVKFHTADPRSPSYITVQDTPPYYIDNTYPSPASDVPIGIRYYIFALPISL